MQKRIKKQVTSIEQFKDSYFLYYQNPPAFGLWLIVIVMLSLIVLLVWSRIAIKTYVVKSNGSIVSNERNYIMSAYSGAITRAFIHEGDYVSQGETLFSVSSVDLDLQEIQINGTIDEDNRKIQLYQRLESCIKDGINSFDENNPSEKPYYYQYETYMNQVAQKNWIFPHTKATIIQMSRLTSPSKIMKLLSVRFTLPL